MDNLTTRFFVSYTGVNLPLKLTNEIEAGSMDNRITYFIGYYDDAGRLLKIEKMVYGEIEFSHVYEYDDSNSVCKAVLTETDEDPRMLVFDSNGSMREM